MNLYFVAALDIPTKIQLGNREGVGARTRASEEENKRGRWSGKREREWCPNCLFASASEGLSDNAL